MAEKQSDAVRLAAVAAVIQGESRRSVARRIGVSESTVRKWCEKDAQFAQKCAEKRNALARDIYAHMDAKRDQMCELIDVAFAVLPEKFQNAKKASDVTTALGTLLDKFNTLPGDGAGGGLLVLSAAEEGEA